MIDNIENRLSIFSGTQYVIIRRISDNNLIKYTVRSDNMEEIEEMLEKCNDGNVYDVVIVSQYKYENLKNVKMRYLSYFYKNNDTFEL